MTEGQGKSSISPTFSKWGYNKVGLVAREFFFVLNYFLEHRMSLVGVYFELKEILVV